MATLKQRMHKKNSSGTYDTVHLETTSSLVLRPSGRTVEEDLTDYLPKTQDSDTPPSTLPFGTLLTGSTIGTNNEKSTKVWAGDAENEPVQLVAYNSDGTLPSNQVYDDIVTDASITAPAIVDITSDNHATISYSSEDKGIVTIPNISDTVTPADMIPVSSTSVLNVSYDNSSSDYTTYLWLFDHTTGSNGNYVTITSFSATYAVDISDYLADTVLLLGYAGTTNYVAYVFVNTSTLAYTTVKSIYAPVTLRSSTYKAKVVYYNDSVYYIDSSGYNYNLSVYKFNITGSTFNGMTLTYKDVFSTSTTATYTICKQLTESGNPDKLVFIGYSKNSSVSKVQFFYYIILTLGDSPEFGTEVYSDQSSVESDTTYMYNIPIDRVNNIDYLQVNKTYCFCTNASVLNSNAGSSSRNPLIVQFTYSNTTDQLTINTVKASSSSWASNITLRVVDDTNWIYVYYIPYVNTSSGTPLYLLAYNKHSQLTTTGYSNIGGGYSISGYFAIYQYVMTQIINNTYIVIECLPRTGSTTKYNCCAVLYHYINSNNAADLGLYPINNSTKALAVTSGGIGDTVRIAYEGTYNVPGVASGSTYSTDTSYAIAKKSGVLTVSEPQQTSKVYYGTYTGDGTRGVSSSNPMSITFPFAPKVLVMLGYSNPSSMPHCIWAFNTSSSEEVAQVWLTDISTSFTVNNGALANGVSSSWMYHKLSSDALTYSWYTSTTNSKKYTYAYNVSGNIYHYVVYG